MLASRRSDLPSGAPPTNSSCRGAYTIPAVFRQSDPKITNGLFIIGHGGKIRNDYNILFSCGFEKKNCSHDDTVANNNVPSSTGDIAEKKMREKLILERFLTFCNHDVTVANGRIYAKRICFKKKTLNCILIEEELLLSLSFRTFLLKILNMSQFRKRNHKKRIEERLIEKVYTSYLVLSWRVPVVTKQSKFVQDKDFYSFQI